MAPLFSKVDLNKLWHDVENEETLICAKFGKDLFNISKVIGRKKWPSFFDSQCIMIRYDDAGYLSALKTPGDNLVYCSIGLCRSEMNMKKTKKNEIQ